MSKTYIRRNKKGQFSKGKTSIGVIILMIAVVFMVYFAVTKAQPTPQTYKQKPTIDNIQKLTNNIANKLREFEQAELDEAQKELEYKRAKLNSLKKEVELKEAEQSYYLYQGIIN